MTDRAVMPTTTTFDELEEATGVRQATFVLEESDSQGETTLHLRSVFDLRYEHPGTWTQEQAREALARHAARLARIECLRIIQSLPYQVVPVILPQLREMAEYETEMWRLRSEHPEPQLVEKWISLPVKT